MDNLAWGFLPNDGETPFTNTGVRHTRNDIADLSMRVSALPLLHLAKGSQSGNRERRQTCAESVSGSTLPLPSILMQKLAQDFVEGDQYIAPTRHLLLQEFDWRATHSSLVWRFWN